MTEALGVYDLFNAVSGLNIPVGAEDEFMAQVIVVKFEDCCCSLQFCLMVAVLSLLTDCGSGEEERGPRAEAGEEVIPRVSGGRRPPVKTRRRRLMLSRLFLRPRRVESCLDVSGG